MVKLTIAGGTGAVAREIVDVLAASQRHEIVILSRSTTLIDPPLPAGVTIRHVEYENPASLREALAGTHTLLSFLQLVSQSGTTAQKNLIDAAVTTGARRIAPSEWASSAFTDMPFYQYKHAPREQLEQLAQTHDFQYSLFQPGLFLEYLGAPYKTTAHLDPLMTVFDFAGRRAMVVEGHEDAVLTLTSVRDVAAAVLCMVDLPDEVIWPRIGGICGNRLSVREIVDMGESIFGRPLTVTKLQKADLEKGQLNSPWGLRLTHKSVAPDQVEEMLKQVAIGTLLSFAKGAWSTTDEVNKLLPGEFHFTNAEEFLANIWGQPVIAAETLIHQDV